jgi:hypothetical protein
VSAPSTQFAAPEFDAVEVDRAEPTDGRHALDRDAALTPIFTSLRRGSGRRPRGRGARTLRVVPEPVERFHDDPPTCPIPIVPALHALDAYPSGGYGPGSVDPYDTGGYREAYAPVDYYVPDDQYAPVDPYPTGGYRGAAVDPYAPASFAPRPDATVPPASRAETTTVWPRIDDRVFHSPPPHSLVSDTGRHHRRLAPAGW